MASLREAGQTIGRAVSREARLPRSTLSCGLHRTPLATRAQLCQHAFSTSSRSSAAAATHDLQELEPDSSLSATVSTQEFDPAGRARKRNRQLPPTSWRMRYPRYYRGPLHPHQPPKASDPSSREFIPGPFTLPRARQTFESTIEPDFMVMSYHHNPPGFEPAVKGQRLRSWDETSPYHKGRPLRGPRGGDNLRLYQRQITWRNVPEIEGITVTSYVEGASEDSAPLHVAGMAIQAITNVRAEARKQKQGIVQWGVKKGKFMSVVCELKGEDAYHFLAKTVDIVMPRIKDWRGVRTSSGDMSGNISFGFTPDIVAYYPEIEINFDTYPTKMIPGCNITVKTSATSDREGRMLLTAMGVPFYGKFRS